MARSPKEQDRDRDREIYRYLFSLAVVYRGEEDNLERPENINFSKTAVRFGEKADYARRIYNLIMDQDSPGYNEAARISTAELVVRLKTLMENIEPGAIRRENIIKLFGYLISLTPEEREDLNLTKSEADVLFAQSFVNIGYHNIQARPSHKIGQGNFLRDSIIPEKILELYKASIGLELESGNEGDFENEEQVKDFITKVINEHLKCLGFSDQAEELDKYFTKVEQRINRIIAQSAFDQIGDRSAQRDILSTYFSPKFIKNLTTTTIENELILDKIPLYLEYIDIKRIEPLPLYTDQEEGNLLNRALIDDPAEILNDSSLSSLYVYRVSIWFRLVIDEKLQEKLDRNDDIPDEVKNRLFKSNRLKTSKPGIFFKIDSTGVGSQSSQIITIINRALFWDVKCIGERYFAIAHDLIHEVTGNQISSPVWSHSLVRLCRLEYLKHALRHKGKYIDYAHVDEVARGDYLGFSLLEASAKSALQARLAAILQANIHPKRYQKDLIDTIIRREILRVSDSFLDYYPFSLTAMETYLKTYKYLKDPVANTNLDNESETDDSLSIHLYCDAYLSIIKACLREGMYRRAKRYFDEIQKLEAISQKNIDSFRPDLLSLSDQECEIFSGDSLAQYEILKAYYLYLFDEQDRGQGYDWETIEDHRKANLISKAWDCLDNASLHLEIRIAKYAAINEVSQAIFYPYFIMLAHINFRKAKLFLYFPTDSANRFPGYPELKDYHYARLHFFEQCRLYAAKNGNQDTYAVYTSLQVWAYIIAGYLVDRSVIFSPEKTIDLSRENCLKQAQQLRDHALISYTEYGRKCYYQIKEKSGISQSGISRLPAYGKCAVDPVPLILQERSDGRSVRQGYGYFDANRFVDDGSLYIDMALLHMKELDNGELLEDGIYLFGTKAANLLFARGMCELCDDENIDTINDWKAKILKAYRLFTYAWAIAEDGGETEQINQDQYRITRPYFTRSYSTLSMREQAERVNYPPPEALSVRDLYPHRLSEMSDIGKVFAIAARLLLMYLTKTTKPTELDNAQRDLDLYESEIHQLIAHFHSTNNYAPESINNQEYFNGHLRPYLTQIKTISVKELTNIDNSNLKYPLNVQQIKQIRDELVRQFFTALQKRN